MGEQVPWVPCREDAATKELHPDPNEWKQEDLASEPLNNSRGEPYEHHCPKTENDDKGNEPEGGYIFDPPVQPEPARRRADRTPERGSRRSAPRVSGYGKERNGSKKSHPPEGDRRKREHDTEGIKHSVYQRSRSHRLMRAFLRHRYLKSPSKYGWPGITCPRNRSGVRVRSEARGDAQLDRSSRVLEETRSAENLREGLDGWFA